MKKTILPLVLVLVSFNSAAGTFDDTFDATGLINTSSDEASLASCATIANLTPMAASMVLSQVFNYQPTTVAEITNKKNTISMLNSLKTVKATNFFNIFNQLPRISQVAAGQEFSATGVRFNKNRDYNALLDAYHTCTQMFNIY
jgi:hypothetical protein